MITAKSTKEAQLKPPCKQSLSQRMTSYLARELQLSDRQIKEIQPVIKSTCDDLGEIHQLALGEASKAIENCRARLVPFLSAEQAAKLSRCESERQRFLAIEYGYEKQAKKDCDH
ncbi:MAG: hypothetical protein M2R45_00842 [Verrucomicrobia subdivision 3 bacterium]|nr:hypothetical protein [Limisphaerales bacterium]MCS1413052.1 hypothetical protein [Limisphaerales bacterium]